MTWSSDSRLQGKEGSSSDALLRVYSVTLGQCPTFVIFLCFLDATGCCAVAHGYDCSNGMWGEMDDEKNWNLITTALMLAILRFIPVVLKNIPKDHKPAFC